MPVKGSASLRARPDIQLSFMEFDLAMNASQFIGNRLYPVIEVNSQNGMFGRVKLEQLLQTYDTKRNSTGGYTRSEFELEDETWKTQEHGHEEKIDERERNIYSQYGVDMIAGQRCRHSVLQNYELRVRDSLYSAANFSLTGAAAQPWDSAANATPKDDVETAIQAVYTATGIWPNTMQISETTFRNLVDVNQVVERIKYSGLDDPKARGINIAALESFFNIDNILVGNATTNTANAPNATPASLWPNDQVWVGKVAMTNDLREPCAGRTFHWGGDGSTMGGTAEEYFNDEKRCRIMRTRMETQEKFLYGVGYRITGTHS